MAEQNYETNETMRREWTRLLEVPLNNRERQRLQEGLEVLSVEEEAKLAAALLRTDPWTAQESVDCLLSLAEYQVCHPAGSYEALGRYALRYELSLPAELEEHVDLEKLGRRYEDFHPGVFVGRSYVEYPPGPPQAQYDGYTLPQEDLSWSVRLKLASPAVPEGVWVRLPDYSDVSGGPPGELDMALEALDVTLIQDCTLLEARCVLPEVQDLMDYEDLGKLIYDGQDLGFALDDAGRGLPDFWGRLAAGLELEHCRTLRQAADIAANARAYDLEDREGEDVLVVPQDPGPAWSGRRVQDLLAQCGEALQSRYYLEGCRLLPAPRGHKLPPKLADKYLWSHGGKLSQNIQWLYVAGTGWLSPAEFQRRYGDLDGRSRCYPLVVKYRVDGTTERGSYAPLEVEPWEYELLRRRTQECLQRQYKEEKGGEGK